MIPRVSKTVLGVRIEAHPIVFPAAAILLLIFVVLTAMSPAVAARKFDAMQAWITTYFGWLYIVSMTGFLIFAIYLCFSRYGNIKLGKPDQKPEFSTLTWFSMLFSAGMGIGMLFWGVAEPLYHFNSPPTGEAGTIEAAKRAMGITLFHWCLHPWALYAIVGLALAYFGYRKGLPLSFRSVFHPLIGDRIYGRLGDLIDILAVLATLFGLATSLGLGAKQVNAGLGYVFGLEQSTQMQLILIFLITCMAVGSLVSGLDVGIRRLSELNMCLVGLLLVFLFVFGPTKFLFGSLVANTGAYVQKLPINSFWTGAYNTNESAGWLGWWTVFYWGWWIAWSPFVGMFIARVSKGRTIREFITGVLLVPTAVAIVWMTAFGSSALHQEIYKDKVGNDKDAIAAVEAKFDYAPRERPLLVKDETHQLPKAADGDWLIYETGVGLKRVGILVKPNAEGKLVSKAGTPVVIAEGSLLNAHTNDVYVWQDADILTGKYMAKQSELTLGQYISAPALSDDHMTRQDTVATAMFVMLEAYPLAGLTALIGTLSVILFFVTSSDSASMVADIIASGGNENPPVGTRLFWGILEGVLAAVLLVAGGLKALQTGSITIGLPFCIIVILMCYSLHKALRQEHAESKTEKIATDEHG